jgi:hypothetical protein
MVLSFFLVAIDWRRHCKERSAIARQPRQAKPASSKIPPDRALVGAALLRLGRIMPHASGGSKLSPRSFFR